MDKKESVLVGILVSELVQVVTGWEQIEAGQVRGRRLTGWEQERLNYAREAVHMAIKAGCIGNLVLGSSERQAVSREQWQRGYNDRIDGRGCLSANGSYIAGYHSDEAGIEAARVDSGESWVMEERPLSPEDRAEYLAMRRGELAGESPEDYRAG